MDGVTVTIGSYSGPLDGYLDYQKTSEIERERLSSLNVKKFFTKIPTTKGMKTFNPLHCIRKPNREAVLKFVNSLVKEFDNCHDSIGLRDLLEKYELESGIALKQTYKKIVQRMGKLGVVAWDKGKGKADFTIKNIAINKVAGSIPSAPTTVPVSTPMDEEKQKLLKIQHAMIQKIASCQIDEDLDVVSWKVGNFKLTVEKINKKD